MIARHEFPRDVRRQAFKRSGGFCEASGPAYGFPKGERCNANLSYGIEFDHYPIRAGDGGPGTLDNCMTVCPKCHRWKTSQIDLPALAKGRRIRDAKFKLRRQSQSFQTNRNGPYKRLLNGEIRLR